MVSQHDSHRLDDIAHVKSAEPHIEALQKCEDKDRDELVRLGKRPVLKVRSYLLVMPSKSLLILSPSVTLGLCPS